MTDPARWTGVEGIRDAVRRRWADGTLPRAFAMGQDFPAIDIPLRHPSAADLGEHFDAARSWVDAVTRGSRAGRAYAVQSVRVGGRLIGATDVPARAVVTTYDQAWQLLDGVAPAESFRALVQRSSADPRPREWALSHPQDAIAIADDWAAMLAAHRWLVDARGSGMYLRQVTAPGVDTKFIERHRRPLAEMLGVSATTAGFTRDLGLAAKPQIVRMRIAPGVFDVPPTLSEMSVRVEELRAVPARASEVLIVENEITYLSVPVPARGVVLWGKGYDADQPASLPWLADVPVRYWGDLDTHGFGILNRVRAWLPDARSVLMDRETLLHHRGRWGVEATPMNGALPGLDAAEQGVYDGLVTDRWGHAVRLEQERIDWEWALAELRKE